MSRWKMYKTQCLYNEWFHMVYYGRIKKCQWFKYRCIVWLFTQFSNIDGTYKHDFQLDHSHRKHDNFFPDFEANV